MHYARASVFLNLFYCLTIFTKQAHQYAYDGTGNNIEHPHWGAAWNPKVRSYPPSNGYVDQKSIPISSNISGYPSARRIVEELFHVASPKADKITNQLLLEFGHFIKFDISTIVKNLTESFHIPCDGKIIDTNGCPFMNSGSTDFDLKHFHEIEFYRATHNKTISPRTSINAATSFLDLSSMYGEDFRKGIFIEMDDDDYPLDKNIMNNSPGLYVVFVIFARYHNLKAKEYAENNPFLDDDAIFEMARMELIAIYQKIVEEKYIPSLLGNKLDTYNGYNSSVNPSIDVFFTSLSFRYGHSALSGVVNVFDENMEQLPQGPFALRDIDVNDIPGLVKEIGLGPFLRGLISTKAKEVDASIVDDLNFWSPMASVFDIQRGRDEGLPPYNSVREAFGLSRKESYEDLAGGDQKVVKILRNLYGEEGIDKIDAYVGALIEKKESALDLLGPIFTRSIKNQFTKLRDGDRFWYRLSYTKQEIEAFPSLSDIIKLVSSSNDASDLPSDVFISSAAAFGQCNADDRKRSCSSDSMNSMSLLQDKLKISWLIIPSTKEFSTSLMVSEPMQGAGFIGVGWGCQEMVCAEIWFCSVNETTFVKKDLTDDCDDLSSNSNELLSCCVTDGTMHNKPICIPEGDISHYPLRVTNACLSSTSASITVQASLCPSSEDNDNTKDASSLKCFNLYNLVEDDTIEFITAYNTIDGYRTHGPSSRTSGTINLTTGSTTSSGSTDSNVFGVHGAFMLFAWLVCAPLGIYIVRYKKTLTWRLEAHISLMGFVASLMLPLILTADQSVDAAANKMTYHTVMGKFIIPLTFLTMIVAGHVRYATLKGDRMYEWIGSKGKLFVHYYHTVFGVGTVFMAWSNCYTGLVQIGTVDIEVYLFNSVSVPLGYNSDIFGYIRRKMFFPYLGVVIAIFIFAEIKHISSRLRRRTLPTDELKTRISVVLNTGNDILETMDTKTFLELTKHGNQYCIINDFVINYTEFADFHPGGRDLLNFAEGSDITQEFLGQRDVNGVVHKHSIGAINTLKSFMIAKFIGSENNEDSNEVSTDIRLISSGKIPSPLDVSTFDVFIPARVVSKELLTSSLDYNLGDKPVILLRLAVPATNNDSAGRMSLLERRHNVDSIILHHYVFRAHDKKSSLMIERKYTLLEEKKDKDEVILSFIISLLPYGKMSNILNKIKEGKRLLIHGPMKCNNSFLQKIDDEIKRHNALFLIAAGTGITPLMSIVNFCIYSYDQKGPRIYLIWLVKSGTHNFSKTLSLDDLVEKSRGRFKYAICYTSRKEEDKSIRFSDKKQKLKNKLKTTVSQIRMNIGRTSVTVETDNNKKFSTHSVDDSGCKSFLSNDLWGNCVEIQYTPDILKEMLMCIVSDEKSMSSGKTSQWHDDVDNVMDGDDEWDIEGGAKKLSYLNRMVFVAGSPTFDRTVTVQLKELGFKKDQIMNFQFCG